MLRRMFLCWRWWRRDDLSNLLHSTLDVKTAAQLPELHGFDKFEQAVSGGRDSKDTILDEMLLGTVTQLLAGRSEGANLAAPSSRFRANLHLWCIRFKAIASAR